MTTIRGKSVQGGVDREIEVTRSGEKVHLHIHSPGETENGWSISVSVAELKMALNRD